MITHKKTGFVVRTMMDFIAFWLIFQWRDGWIWGNIKQFGMFLWRFLWPWLLAGGKVLQKIWQGILFITPLGRAAAEKVEVHYMLVVGGVCAINGLILFFGALLDSDVYRCKLLWGILPVFCAMVIWYSSYAAALLVSALQITGYIWMMGIVILVCVLVGSLLFFVLFGRRSV